MMIIVRFPALEYAEMQLRYYTDLARNETSPPDFALTIICKHTTEEIYWFNGTDCINNGGEGRETIQSDIDNQDTIEVESYQQLIDMGYLPQPTD